ncbi:hypothetical protein Taro_035563, partial [Colocasia esculenta]|nr:hypothetical protein [Colocasia esculenta]
LVGKRMASSDDEELMPEAVTEYHFVNEKEEPVCFSLLPVLWSEDESLGVHKDQVFLYGKTDDGLQKVYKQVIAWKAEIEGDSPAISVLSKDKKWLKLLKPRKAYEDTIRKILITLECLLYLKSNPASSDKSVWEHIRKVFSQFEVKASEDDLLGHLTFIHTMIKRDETLSKSQ